MNPFVPEFEGALILPRVPDDFTDRIRERVKRGLFMPGRRTRANYAVRNASKDEIAFGAEDLLTAYNVGLNEVQISRQGRDAIRYHVSFWRWTWLAVAHGAVIGLMFSVLFLVAPAMRHTLEAYPYGPQAFWTLVAFFGLIWPWALTAIHRRFADKALRRILQETLV
jgi:hypothetical protein